jgi:hypothetical protein
MITRRVFASSFAAALARGQKLPPFRAITKGPKFHWFGYYDKLQFDPAGRYALGMEVDFEHRSPRPDDVIRLGMVDLADNDRWTELGATRAWNWQQGAMLQWLPGSRDEVIWNDRREGAFASVVKNVKTGRERVLPAPVYCLSPDGREAVYCDFRRLNDCRPGYGYAGIPDPNKDQLTPDDAGIWRMDLKTGKSSLVVSIADAARIPYPGGYSRNAKHWFNHLLYSTDGRRLIFLHRWRGDKEGRSFSTRMFTAARDGRDLYILDPHGKTSHFIWRDPQHVLAWAWHPSHGERFYLYRDKTEQVEVVGKDVMTVNGHCTYLPGGRYILNDTYPDRERNQNVYLYEIATARRIPLRSFHSPREYSGEWRCDTHPRSSPDGLKVIVDSPHAGGRQMYLIDLSEIVS